MFSFQVKHNCVDITCMDHTRVFVIIYYMYFHVVSDSVVVCTKHLIMFPTSVTEIIVNSKLTLFPTCY